MANDVAGDALGALRGLVARRAGLDRSERLLIDAARAGGTTWAEIAAALGLGSRQAAEQRWLRLAGGARPAGRGARMTRRDPAVERLRAHVALLHDRLVWLDGGGTTGPTAAALRLARETLSLAADAPAGALHDLARAALEDLRRVPTAALGSTAEAVQRLGDLCRAP